MSSSGSASGADMILANARSVGFNDICYKNITPSDGNCWYHAVLDQIRRLGISHLFPAYLLNLDHHQLRNSVLLFVLQNQNFNANASIKPKEINIKCGLNRKSGTRTGTCCNIEAFWHY